MHRLASLVEGRLGAIFLQLVHQLLHPGGESRIGLQLLRQNLFQSTLPPFGVRLLLGKGQGLLCIGESPLNLSITA